MPDPGKQDLTPIWYQELRVTGAYAYSLETLDNGQVRTFQLVLDLLSDQGWSEGLARLVRHRFPLTRHRQAIATAMRPGRHEAVKTVFDLADAA